VYLCTLKTKLRGSFWQQFADRVIEAIWFDVLIDAVTVIAFGLAFWRLLLVVGAGI
jgi:hypothetical protein